MGTAADEARQRTWQWTVSYRTLLVSHVSLVHCHCSGHTITVVGQEETKA